MARNFSRIRGGHSVLQPAFVALWLLAAGPSRAQALENVTVQWQGPACGRPASFEAELRRLLGPHFEVAAPSQFSVVVTHTNEGVFRLELATQQTGDHGERTLRMVSCEDVREAAALLIAMALNPAVGGQPVDGQSTLEDTTRQEEPSAAEAPGKAAAPPRDPVETAVASGPGGLVDASPLDGASDRHHPPVLLSVGALGDFGALPAPSAGASLGLALAFQHLRVALHGRFLLPRAAADLPEAARATVGLYAGAAGVCGLWPAGRWRLGPCGELEIGWLAGRASGVEAARSGGAVWAGMLGGGLLEYTLHERISLQFMAQAGAALTRARFALREARPFHTTAPVVLRTSLGLVFRWGSVK